MTDERPALGCGWTLWRHALLRGAGFPFSRLDDVFRSEDGAAAVWDVASCPRLREAVTWQNRPAVENAFDLLLRRPRGTTNAKVRQVQALVARYLQRYCAKNDTIGFFGPVAWVAVGGEPHFEAAPDPVSSRAVFFEPWAVLALAGASVDHDARMRAPVRLPGHLRLEETGVRGPTRFIALTDDEMALTRQADGRPAADLLADLARADKAGIDWLDVLSRLTTDGILRWGFPVTISLAPARQWIDLGGAPALSAMDKRLEAVRRAAGQAPELSASLLALEQEFEAWTGGSAWRHAGRTYAGRGLVFEECQRAITMDVGRAALGRVGPALTIALRVARWYTFAVATRLATSLSQAHRALGGVPVPLHTFWSRTSALFDADVPAAVAGALDGVRRRWNEMWAMAEQRTDGVYLDVVTAEAYVEQYFAAPCPGWPGARHHAPDLMWQAADPDVLLTGGGTPVLAELHPGVTPFTTLSALALCPVRGELEAEWNLDFPDPLVTPIPWEDFARSTLDTRLAKNHWHLDLGTPFASDRPAAQVLRAADFDVYERHGRLVAVHRRGYPVFDLLEVFERRIKLRAATAFSLSDGLPRGPRRYLGPLLVQRAHWTIDELLLRQLSMQWPDRLGAWRRAHGVPDRVFVRSPEEIKPIYVDFQSPVSLDVLLRLARKSGHLSISEMYPDPDGLWLQDGKRRSYTSEVRLVAVDPVPFDPSSVWGKAPDDRGDRQAWATAAVGAVTSGADAALGAEGAAAGVERGR